MTLNQALYWTLTWIAVSCFFCWAWAFFHGGDPR